MPARTAILSLFNSQILYKSHPHSRTTSGPIRLTVPKSSTNQPIRLATTRTYSTGNVVSQPIRVQLRRSVQRLKLISNLSPLARQTVITMVKLKQSYRLLYRVVSKFKPDVSDQLTIKPLSRMQWSEQLRPTEGMVDLNPQSSLSLCSISASYSSML